MRLLHDTRINENTNNLSADENIPKLIEELNNHYSFIIIILFLAVYGLRLKEEIVSIKIRNIERSCSARGFKPHLHCPGNGHGIAPVF
jgi:hypothetical protein